MAQRGDGVTAESVRGATFPKPALGRRGYDDKSVDDVLQLAARRLDGRGHLKADDLGAIRFRKSALLSRGYDRDAVDRFMVRVVDAISDLES
jgi:DivIVA domain-containing protein